MGTIKPNKNVYFMVTYGNVGIEKQTNCLYTQFFHHLSYILYKRAKILPWVD